MRPLRPEDCDGVAALIRSAFASLATDVDPPPSALRVRGEDIAAHLAAGGSGVIAGQVRACLLWTRRDSALHVSRLAVAVECRGRGLALAMLGLAEDEAGRLGLTRLTLSTRLALESNRRLFARAGFVEGARHAHPGFAQPTYIDMERTLPNALSVL